MFVTLQITCGYSFIHSQRPIHFYAQKQQYCLKFCNCQFAQLISWGLLHFMKSNGDKIYVGVEDEIHRNGIGDSPNFFLTTSNHRKLMSMALSGQKAYSSSKQDSQRYILSIFLTIIKVYFMFNLGRTLGQESKCKWLKNLVKLCLSTLLRPCYELSSKKCMGYNLYRIPRFIRIPL